MDTLWEAKRRRNGSLVRVRDRWRHGSRSLPRNSNWLNEYSPTKFVKEHLMRGRTGKVGPGQIMKGLEYQAKEFRCLEMENH